MGLDHGAKGYEFLAATHQRRATRRQVSRGQGGRFGCLGSDTFDGRRKAITAALNGGDDVRAETLALGAGETREAALTLYPSERFPKKI